MNTGFGEFGAVIEAMNTIKEDVRELKTAILDPDDGMAGKLKVVELKIADLDERIKPLSEIVFAYAILKWAALILGGSSLLGFGALLAKAVLWP